MTAVPEYEVYAIQYARAIRPSSDYFLGADPHEGPAPIFYYVWLIRNANRCILVDTGFDAQRAQARGREFQQCPTEGLRSLGVDPAEIDTVVITHLHYDHAGNLNLFPNARFVLQDEEMRFATGRHMRHSLIQAPFELSDVLDMVTHNYAGRVRFVDGAHDLARGVRLHHVPGHSMGLQAVTVNTRRGRLCLASDAAHFFDNIALGNPFRITTHVAQTLEGHDRVLELAGGYDRLIPGHDPKVAELYPAHPRNDLIFLLHEPPGHSPAPA